MAMVALAGTLLALSGVAALTYQVVWVRLLSLLFGSSSESVSTVLAAFFLGLALGSAAALRIARGRNLVATYAGLELLISAWGGLLLWLLPRLGAIVASWGATHVAVKFVLAAGLLLPPTVAMGATLPLLAAAAIRATAGLGRGLSALYAANTAGALIGALASGFVFIPRLGLDGATYVAMGLNLGGAALAWTQRGRANDPAPPEPVVSSAASRTRRAALVVIAATGFASIAAEVAWTKYLVVFTGGTVFGYSLILSVFLAGIALGSWASRAVLPMVASPARWLGAGMLMLSLSVLLSRQVLTFLPTGLSHLNHSEVSGAARLLLQLGYVGGSLLVPTFLFGAVFPLTLTVYCHDLAGLRGRLGHAYAVNTVASVAGSLCAGFWIVPHLGTDALLASVGVGLAGVGVLTIVPLVGSRAWRAGMIVVALAAGAAATWGPKLRYEPLIAAVDYVYVRDASWSQGPSRFRFLREGRTGVVSLAEQGNGRLRLQNNGLAESVLDPGDPEIGSRAETLLGVVPYLLHPDPREAFVVGYGGGTTARALLRTGLQSVRVVELEPATVEAVLTAFDRDEAGLSDARLTLEFNDARNDLLLRDATYDILVAQPSHPWLAGASAVFTREYFELVRSRLNEGGICGQWVNLFNMDTTTLLSIGKAFFEVFPHGFTLALEPPRDLLLFGSMSPLHVSDAVVAQRREAMETGGTFHRTWLEGADDVLRHFALSREQVLSLAAGVEANDDMNILSEVRLASLDMSRYQRLTPQEDPRRLLDENMRFDLAGLVPGLSRESILDRIASRMIELDERVRARRALEELGRVNPQRAGELRERLDGHSRRMPDPGP